MAVPGKEGKKKKKAAKARDKGEGADKAKAKAKAKAKPSKKKIKRKKSSKYVGAFYDKSTKYWHSFLRYKKKQSKLGMFKLEVDAARAYDRAATLLGKPSKCNFATRREYDAAKVREVKRRELGAEHHAILSAPTERKVARILVKDHPHLKAGFEKKFGWTKRHVLKEVGGGESEGEAKKVAPRPRGRPRKKREDAAPGVIVTLLAPPGPMGLAFQFLKLAVEGPAAAEEGGEEGPSTGQGPLVTPRPPRYHVVVTDIEPNCQFGTKVARGDRLLSIDGLPVTMPHQLGLRTHLERKVQFVRPDARTLPRGRPRKAPKVPAKQRKQISQWMKLRFRKRKPPRSPGDPEKKGAKRPKTDATPSPVAMKDGRSDWRERLIYRANWPGTGDPPDGSAMGGQGQRGGKKESAVSKSRKRFESSMQQYRKIYDDMKAKEPKLIYL